MAIARAKAIKLRNAWFTEMSADDVAKKYGMASGQRVRNFWKDEKAGGRLPQHQARPHFEARTTIVPAPMALGIDPIDIDLDDGESVNHAPAVPSGDPLLRALRLVHGGEKIRGINDEMPAQLLMIEAGDEYQRFTPSPSRVRDFQRGRDAYVAALMKDKPAPSNCVYARVGRAWWVMSAAMMLAGPFLAFEAVRDWGRAFGLVHKGKSK